MGAPQEWNLFTVANGLFLFGMSGGVTRADLAALPLPLVCFLLVVEGFVPLLGNFRSKYSLFRSCCFYHCPPSANAASPSGQPV